MRKKFALLAAITTLVSIYYINSPSTVSLKPFTSDGCSVFPDGTFKQKNLWLNCCIKHDYDYWQGGSFQDKLASDQALKLFGEKVGQPEVAALMLAGVRVGGSAYLPTQFRWGYGWPYPRLYGDLSKVEQEQVKKHQRQLHEIIID